MHNVRSFWRLAKVICVYILIMLGLTGCLQKDDDSCCCTLKNGKYQHWYKTDNWFSSGKSCGSNSDCASSIYTDKKSCDNLSPVSKTLFTPITKVYLASTATILLPAILPVRSDTLISTIYTKSCLQECAPTNQSPFCLVIRKSDAANFSHQLDQLSSIFRSSEGAIPKEKIMKIFEIEDDPCNRTATSVSDGAVVNSGDACNFKIAFKIGPVSQRLFTISLPEELRGSIAPFSDISVKFEMKENAAILKIDDLLNNDFGGYIQSISKQNNDFLIGTENGCIAFR